MESPNTPPKNNSTAMFRIINSLYKVFQRKGCNFPVPHKKSEHDVDDLFPLPFLSTKFKNNKSTEDRLRKAVRQWTNMIIYNFNSLNVKKRNLNCSIPHSEHQPSHCQQRAIHAISEDVRSFLQKVRLEDSCPTELVRDFIRAKGPTTNSYTDFNNEPAQKIENVDKIDLPKQGPGIKSEVWMRTLDPLMKRFIQDPESFISNTDAIPDTKMHADDDIQRKLVDKLVNGGYASWEEESFCYPSSSGCFQVAKNNESDMSRLILNLSNVNKLWERPIDEEHDIHAEARRCNRLPSPEDIKWVVFPIYNQNGSTSEVVVTKMDVQSAFYNLECPSQLRKFFSLTCASPELCTTYPKEAGELKQTFKVCFNRLPMGFIFSVFCMQAFTSSLSLNHIDDHRVITKTRVTRPPFAGVVIDDWFCASTNSKEDTAILTRWWSDTQASWRNNSLPTKDSKNQFMQSNCELLGWMLEKTGKFGLSARKLWHIVLPSFYLLGKFKSHGGLRSRLVGKQVSASLPNRLSLSLFDESFKVYEQVDKCIAWTKEQIKECLAWTLMCPFLNFNLKAQYNHWVSISDAARHATLLEPKKGRPVRTTPALAHGLGGGYGFLENVESLATTFACSRNEVPSLNTIYQQHQSEEEKQEHKKLTLNPVRWPTREPFWRCSLSIAYYCDQIICIGEMRGIRLTLSGRAYWASSCSDTDDVTKPYRGGRVMLCTDSSPCMYALTKGRSSCKGLNQEIRLIFINSIICHEQYLVAYIASSANWWADGKSRQPLFKYINKLRQQKRQHSNKPTPANHHDPSLHQSFDATCGYPGEGPNNQANQDSDGGDTEDEYGHEQQQADWALLEKELQTLGLKKETSKRYSAKIKEFEKWCIDTDRHVPDYRDEDEVDLLVSLFLLHRRSIGYAPSSALLSGLRASHPKLRLPYAGRVFGKASYEWRAKPALPFDYNHVLAICGKAAAQKQWGFLISNACMWLGFLRCSESLRLTPGDLCFISEQSHLKLVISLKSSKTSKNRPDSILVDEEHLVPLVRMLQDAVSKLQEFKLRGRTKTKKLVDRFNQQPMNNMTYQKFRTRYNDLLTYFALDKQSLADNSALPSVTRGLGFRSHSMRRGRCVDCLIRKQDTQSIMLRGRWADIKSFRRYASCSLGILVASSKTGNSKFSEYMKIGQKIIEKYKVTGRVD